MIIEVNIKRGDVFFADLSPVRGSEQGGQRPVLIIQNDVGNRYSPTVIVAAITAKIAKAKLPTHVEVEASTVGLLKDSVVLMEQVRTIDKTRLIQKLGHLDAGVMKRVDHALVISLGLSEEA
nr:type II toxin-antitoxin system PemK/MazF family toxin [Fusibacter paucivorans]